MMRKKVGMLLSGLLSLTLLAAPVNTIHAESLGKSYIGLDVHNIREAPNNRDTQNQGIKTQMVSKDDSMVIVQESQLPDTSAVMAGGVWILMAILISSIGYAWYVTQDDE